MPASPLLPRETRASTHRDTPTGVATTTFGKIIRITNDLLPHWSIMLTRQSGSACAWVGKICICMMIWRKRIVCADYLFGHSFQRQSGATLRCCTVLSVTNFTYIRQGLFSDCMLRCLIMDFVCSVNSPPDADEIFLFPRHDAENAF